MRSLPAHIVILLLIASGIAACKDDPVASNGGNKDTCDTCIVDTTDIDTTDTTVVINPNDTTSHDFVWTEYSIPNEASITGCWVFNDNEIWAISNRLYRYSDGQWIHKPLKNQHGWDMNSGLSSSSLFGFDTNDTWIIYLGILWHYRNGVAQEYRLFEDGTGLLNTSVDGGFRAAWGTSSKDMFFVGDKGVIVHFDGTNWKKFSKVTDRDIRSVWGRNSNDVWACGWNSSTALSVLLHYNGATWEEIDVTTLGDIRLGAHGLLNIWTTDSAGHRVVIGGGSLVWRKTDEGPWRQDSAELRNELGGGGFAPVGIQGNSANDFIASGGYGYISHWNGNSWHRFDQFWQPGSIGYAVNAASMKGDTYCAAGVKGGSWIAIGRRAK